MSLKHSILSTVRTFRRNRLFTLINILGLSIGISASLVIYLIADHEFGYDRFEQDRDQVYKVVLDVRFSGMQGHSGAVPAPLGKAVQREIMGIELTVPVFRFQNDGMAKVAVPGGRAGHPLVFPRQPDVIYAGASYFRFMPYRWIAGSPDGALKEPFSVVLTKSRARLYFPGLEPADIVGRRLTYNDDLTLNVSGVVGDLEKQSDLAGNEFISLATIDKTSLRGEFEMDDWNDWMSSSQLYLKLAPGRDPAAVEKQLAAMYKKYKRQDPQRPDDGATIRLLPLREVHFNTDYESQGQRVASRTTLYGLLAVAAFLLLLACLNFINLSTAQAVRRAREIGIRKTMGSSRSRLIRQFLGETLLLVIGATLLSIVLTPLLLSVFAGFIPPDLHPDWLRHPGTIVFLMGLILAISGLAGFYPAYLLSGFNPVRVLKDGWFAGNGRTNGAGLRKVFTVSQFVIAQFFIIATLMVAKQIRYSLNSDLGFRKDAILTFEVPVDTAVDHRAALLAQIGSLPEVEMTATGLYSPATRGVSFGSVSYKPRPDVHTPVLIRWGDSNYIPLYQIKLLAGRNVRRFDMEREVLINASYASLLGFRYPEDALNKPLTVNGKELPIVGVMADFHTQSMHVPMMPLVFTGSSGNMFHIRLKTTESARENWTNAIEKMQKLFHQFYPGVDWNYTFVDDTVAQWYKAEQDMAHLLYWATGLTILISCLGLLGLVIYTTNMRTREIGIRKVLGAPVAGIVSLLSGEFVKLVLLAFLIAVPVAWWASNRWLQGFAYRTSISWGVFAFGGLVLLVVALVTLSFQVIRTALANPVSSLRTE
jgi:ABC-type lipoprotein release transport system permease subunit